MSTFRRIRVAGSWLCLALGLVLGLAACGRAIDEAAIAPAATPPARIADPGDCSITRPPDRPFVPPAPPAPSSPSIPGGEFWYGTPALWTSLHRNGTWWGLPYHDGPYTQKVFWWSQGYDWQSPLTVTGVRTDGYAPPLRASTATNAYADDIGSSILVGVEIPTAGCWQITGHLKGVTLSFVVWVAA